MKHRTLKIAAAALLTLSLMTIPVAAADMGNMTDPRAMRNFSSPVPRSGEGMPGDTGASDSLGTSDGNGSNITGDTGTPGDMGGNGGTDTSGDMFGQDTTDGNLGDTSGPTESGDGVIDGTADSDNTLMDNDLTDTVTENNGSMLGIIITLLLIGAVVVLIFALLPKRKS